MPSNAATLICCFTVAVILAGGLHAFSPARPKPQDVFSPNGKFVLALDPDRATQPVFAASDRSEALWVLAMQPWLGEYYLSDDAKVVAVVAWEFVKEENLAKDGITFYGPHGRILGFSIDQLCHDPYTTRQVIGPVGDFWRRWLWKERAEGGDVIVHTVDGNVLRFNVAEAKLVASGSGDSMPTESWIGPAFWPVLLVAMGLLGVVWVVVRRGRRIVRLGA